MNRDEFLKLDEFTQAYITAALWSSTDQHDTPLDSNYDESDITDETIAKIVEDCKNFQAKADLTDYPNENAGHDFWLTRNGHGAGFWENDFGTPESCEQLTKLSKEFGEVDLYVGDDGKIYS